MGARVLIIGIWYKLVLDGELDRGSPATRRAAVLRNDGAFAATRHLSRSRMLAFHHEFLGERRSMSSRIRRLDRLSSSFFFDVV